MLLAWPFEFGNWLQLKLFHLNSPLKALRALVGWPLLILGAFMLAGWVGSSIPVNSEWRQPDEGVDILLQTNGVHVSLIIPMQAEGEDLSDLIRPQDLSDRSLYGTHAMIGWGHGGVYRNAQTWADVRTRDVLSAIIGSDDVLLHVYHVTDPQPGPRTKQLRVTRTQYRAIAQQVRSAFRLTKDGHPIPSPAYGADNIFYAANGRYTAFHTCNEWTGAVLRDADVRMGAWTPFSGGVMRWF